MCIKYIRRYNCPRGNGQPSAEHVLLSTIPCSSPISCVGDGFGTRDVSFSGPCEQHTPPNAWATFNHLATDEQSTFALASPEDLAANICSYLDTLLDLLALLMNDAIPKAVVPNDYVTLENAVEIIARELRCPSCGDDITVCPCPPGQNRVMYNISRAFRTAEAQRLLPILRQRFGGEAVRQAARQAASGAAAASNRRQTQTRLLYDMHPPSREAAVSKCRSLCHWVEYLQRRRLELFDHADELGRVQWSAISIIASYFKYDTGVPPEIAEHLARSVLPMLYPQKAIDIPAYKFGFNVNASDGLTRKRISTTRLSDYNFWTPYQGMVRQLAALVLRGDGHRGGDLDAVSVALDDRMDNVRSTSHGLAAGERAAFHAIAAGLLPVTKHLTTEEVERGLGRPPARCTACRLPFSEQAREPATPCVGSYPDTRAAGQQVHMPVCYEQCASSPAHRHAFCLRGWARQLMERGADDTVTGVKAKESWRCNTCFVDPWRVG